MKYIDSSIKRPYYQKDFIETIKKIKSHIDENIYKVGVSITGEAGNRLATVSTGYAGHDDITNYFIFDKDDLLTIREMIDTAIKEIDDDKNKKKELDSIRDELKRYIEHGYVKKIKIIRTSTFIPNGYHDGLYSAYQIKPIFEVDDNVEEDVNIGLTYIEFLYLSPNEDQFNKTLSYLKCGHDEVEIEFIGYNRKEEVKKYIMEAKRDLSNFDIKDHFNKRPSQEDINKAKDILSKLGMIPK